MPRTLRTALNILAATLLLVAVTAQAQTTPAAESAPAAGAGTPPQAAATAAAADADPDAHFKGKMGGTFGKDIIDVLPSAKRVAVPAFRLAFITNNAVTAQVRGSYLPGRDSSGARSSLHLALKGVDAAALQAITDKAYAQLLDQLRQSGREVVPVEEMKEFFGTVNPTESTAAKPYSKEQNGQTASIFAPTGMPLVFTHFDQWGDRGSFDLNNYRRLGEFSHKWNAAVIAPLVIVNFARMSSSGNTSGLTSRTAETGAELAMSVAGYNSYYARSEEFRNNVVMKGDEGSFNMAAPFASPMTFGTMKLLAQEDNSAVKSVVDIFGKLAGLANAGGAARSTARYEAETTNDAYSAAALDAVNRSSAMLAKWLRKYPAP